MRASSSLTMLIVNAQCKSGESAVEGIEMVKFPHFARGAPVLIARVLPGNRGERPLGEARWTSVEWLLGGQLAQYEVEHAAVAVVLGFGGGVNAQAHLELFDLTILTRGPHDHARHGLAPIEGVES